MKRYSSERQVCEDLWRFFVHDIILHMDALQPPKKLSSDQRTMNITKQEHKMASSLSAWVLNYL